jgi:excisionase family DNA binding protein
VIELSNTGPLVHHSAWPHRRPGHPSTVRVSEANLKIAMHPCGRSEDHISTRRGRRRTSRRHRSEEYMEKLLLSPEEAAEALGVGRSRVYDLMRTRQLLSVRIGKSRRVPMAAVHAYVERLSEQDALA